MDAVHYQDNSHGWATTGFNKLMVFGADFGAAVPEMNLAQSDITGNIQSLTLSEEEPTSQKEELGTIVVHSSYLLIQLRHLLCLYG